MITDQKSNKSIVGVFFTGSKDDIQIAVTNKPNMIRRFFIRLFMGWKFVKVADIKSMK